MYLLSISPWKKKGNTYLEQYINFRFTSILSNGVEKSQCVRCNVALSAESVNHKN